MKKLEKIILLLKENQRNIQEKYHITKMGVFGSYARGEATENSDLDILVEFEVGYNLGLLTFCNLENYLTDLLEINVDLVMKDGLKPQAGKQILSEVIYL